MSWNSPTCVRVVEQVCLRDGMGDGFRVRRAVAMEIRRNKFRLYSGREKLLSVPISDIARVRKPLLVLPPLLLVVPCALGGGELTLGGTQVVRMHEGPVFAMEGVEALIDAASVLHDFKFVDCETEERRDAILYVMRALSQPLEATTLRQS